MDTQLQRILAPCFLLLLTCQLSYGQWTQTRGPIGGRISSLVVKENRLLAGTVGGGIFATSGCGLEWEESGAEHVGRYVLCLLDAGELLFSGSEGGVNVSSDGGFQWMQVNNGITDLSAFRIKSLAEKDGKIFAASVDSHVFCTATDSIFWVDVTSGLSGKTINDLASDLYGVYAATNDGVFLYSENDSTWYQRGLAGKTIRVLLSSDSLLFAGTQREEVYSSSNGGETWDVWSSDPSGLPTRLNDLLLIGDSLFAATEDGVYVTTQGGLWSGQSTNLTSTVVNALAVAHDCFYAGTEGGAFILGEEGWAESNAGMLATSVRAILPRESYIFSGTLGNAIFRSDDNGDHWEPRSSGIAASQVSSLVETEDTIFAGTENGVYMTTNDAISWTYRGLGSERVTSLIEIDRELFAGTLSGVFRAPATDTTWIDQSLGLPERGARSMMRFGDSLLVGTEDGVFLSPLGADLSWSSVGLSEDTVLALKRVGEYIFAGVQRVGLYRARVDDMAWKEVGIDVIDTSAGELLVLGESLFVPTGGKGVFFSADTGKNWQSFSDGLGSDQITIMATAGPYLLAGTDGTGIWRRQLPPPPPLLLTPVDSSDHLSPDVTLTWSSSPEATSYEIETSLTPDFLHLAVDATTSTTTHNVELAHATRYYWRVRASSPGGPGAYSATFTFAARDTMNFENQIAQSFPANPQSTEEYLLTSFPGIMQYRVGDLLPGEQRIDWRIFADNGGVPPDHLTELSADSLLRSGEGYFLIARGALWFSGDVAMPPLDTLGSYRIAVAEGWNIIGNPFDRPISVDAIRSANNEPLMTFFSYDGGWPPVTEIKVFGGYYVYVEGLVELELPYPFPGMQIAPAIQDVQWQADIVYESSSGIDRVTLGIAPAAMPGRDGFDQRKPLGPDGRTLCAFYRPDWDPQWAFFYSDFRPELGAGQAWEMRISDPACSQGTLHFEGIENLPSGFLAALVNPSTGWRVNLEDTTEHKLFCSEETSVLKLLIGTPEFIESEGAATIPREFALGQNYPNPFNSSTAFHVQLPQPSQVKVQILSLLGEQVVLLADEFRVPGSYTYHWNGVGRNNIRVASGIYFYRMFVDGAPFATKKMVLLR